MRKVLIFLFLFLFSVAHSRAQDNPSQARENEITLEQAVSYAMEHSPVLHSAAAEVRRREGVATTTRAGLLPQVDLLGDASHTGHDHAYPPATSPRVIRFDDTIYAAGAELKLLIWDFGQTARELAAARERIGAARALQEQIKQEVIFNVASLYLKTLTYVDLIEAAQSTRKSLGVLLDQTGKLVEAGRAVQADALKVATRLAQIDSDLASLDAGRRTSLSQLAAAMGLNGDLPRLVYSPPEKATVRARSERESDLLLEALAQRSDLKSQKQEVQATSDLETAARLSQWPRTEFRAGAYEFAGPSPISSLGSTGPKPDDAEGDWAVGVHLTFPIFDAGKRRGQIQAAAAQRELAQAAENKLKLEIQSEVRSALAELESAQSRVQATQQSVAQAREVLRNEQLKYEAGRSVINFVLDAEAALLTNQSLLKQAQRSVSIASLILHLRIGRMNSAVLSSPQRGRNDESEKY